MVSTPQRLTSRCISPPTSARADSVDVALPTASAMFCATIRLDGSSASSAMGAAPCISSS